ncbi:MAG TPA: Maf family nucleotide pyrophosphatase [Acidisphaera sp.]|nr:Maf family nucleotide pyrophosphatase [Acidisphaera sp.]
MLQADQPPLVLASASAARRALLAAAGLRFEAVAADIDEAAIREREREAGRHAGQAALALAFAKAASVADRRPDAVVIGADQILVCDGAWFDKPADLAQARAQLCRLRGREHVLTTGLVLLRGTDVLLQHLAQPRLTLRAFSDAFLDEYLRAEGTGVLGSVGCYRLEGLGLLLFDAVEGEHGAILGLPMLGLLRGLRVVGLLTT